ncbi:cation:proton antiporter [Hydrogenobacter hydrogenophilus]|uniref:Transporter, CPA2 family n=1 Tax=Hydrogenobacter hydrogenophilus TaxID=35835 RepID=A0A285P3S5_9AQUI|nr:cation:proton antiporter [Hydrogenobacter hydrogenophilus]SNZ16392.1 transporter, CPA2 family [Hydrogenobacter hydrogenophilus]
MDLHTVFLHLALILFLGRIVGDTFSRLGIPSVIGEILVGILLGKSALGIIEPNEIIKLLAEIGVILLLFNVGLEADLQRLKQVGIFAFLVAFVGAFLPMALGTIISYYFLNLPLLTSLFIGGTLTATSIGITVKVLEELGKMKERFAQIVLGAAVLDDVLGVVLLAGLYEFSKGGVVKLDATTTLMLYITTFFILSPILAQTLAKIIQTLSVFLRTEDFIPPAVLSLIFLFAFLAHKVGSPEILGAFTAGLALSRSFSLPFALLPKTDEKLTHKIEQTITPLVWILTPIFFVYVGLEMNLRVINLSSYMFWLMSFLILMVAVAGKVLSGFIVKGSLRERLLVGFSMLPRGEVGLIFAELGRKSGAFDPLVYAMTVFVIGITTFLSPVALKVLLRIS